MARKTIRNVITTPEKLKKVNPDNLQLAEDFLDYLESIDRAKSTIYNYKSDLDIFWCWNLDWNKNKFFVDLKKRDIIKFQKFALDELCWSPNRIAREKACLQSLSNYIVNMLDDEFEDFVPIVNKIENPVKKNVRTKTVLDSETVDFLLQSLVEEEKYEQACAVALAAFSGSRKAELARFKTHYFDKENLVCEGALYKTPEKIRTKGRGRRTGKMLYKYVLANDFQPYLDLWMKERERLGIDSEWLLVTEEDGEWVQIKLSTLTSYAKSCSRIIEDHFYFHSLRHQLCTRMTTKYNLPTNIVKEYFGWSSTEMIDVYCDTEPEEEFSKYFKSDGMVKVKTTSIEDI